MGQQARLTSIEQPRIDALNSAKVCSRLVNIFSAIFLIPARDKRDQHEQSRIRTSAYSLKELSLLKELDTGYEAEPKTESERDAHRRRQQRHHEITIGIGWFSDRGSPQVLSTRNLAANFSGGSEEALADISASMPTLRHAKK